MTPNHSLNRTGSLVRFRYHSSLALCLHHEYINSDTSYYAWR